MPERLTAFSEGVFAVLITGLVPELRPPGVPTYSELLTSAIRPIRTS